MNQSYICHLCGDDDCRENGAKKIRRELERLIAERGIETVEIRITKCQSRCEDGPVLTVMPGPHTYGELRPRDMAEIVDQLGGNGQPVRAHLLKKNAKKLKQLKTK